MNILIGITAYNNLKYTKMCIDSIRRTMKSPYDLLVIDDYSTDDTPNWLKQQDIKFIRHNENLGLAYSINDLYDAAWKDDENTLFILLANDTILFDDCINGLIRGALETDFELLNPRLIDTKGFLNLLPEKKSLFTEKSFNLIDSTFDAYKEFEKTGLWKGSQKVPKVTSGGNLGSPCLIHKKSFFDKTGYYDVSFYPIYMCDCDMGRRVELLGNTKRGCATSSWVFHFWSRTLCEGKLVDVISKNHYDKLRHWGLEYYCDKWGGKRREERFTHPFDGELRYPSIIQEHAQVTRITSRENELEIIKYWKDKAAK